MEGLPSLQSINSFAVKMIRRWYQGSGKVVPIVVDLRALRACVKISLHFGALRRPSGKAWGVQTVNYLSDEQRRQTGWIGV